MTKFKIGDFVIPVRGTTVCKVTNIYNADTSCPYYYTRSACGTIPGYENNWRKATNHEIEVEWTRQHKIFKYDTDTSKPMSWTKGRVNNGEGI